MQRKYKVHEIERKDEVKSGRSDAKRKRNGRVEFLNEDRWNIDHFDGILNVFRYFM